MEHNYPRTKINKLSSLINNIDMVLFLSVFPGFYGARFLPEVLDKIRDFKRKYPSLKTGVDGGINLNNIREVRNTGVDNIYVGSAILKAENPKKAYLNLIEKAYE